MKRQGFDVAHSETSITPVIIGEAQVAKDFSAKLFDKKIFATTIVFPTVPQDTARIRIMVSATHSKEDLDKGMEVFVSVGREMGVIS
ncbi:MAG: aminotransferase class I/II-fold pyridoxal phosphate-dependent enzyme [Synergistaceae bacterium]|jgi:glycine C-acetyltransferase|nr:aminotransferase class I/II-fold pyridoxal phosphate-dependent enzyme [Synergistaceae bacterium]